MGKHDKKTGKGRLDKFYKLAKEQGYRARSALYVVHLPHVGSKDNTLIVQQAYPLEPKVRFLVKVEMLYRSLCCSWWLVAGCREVHA